MTDASCLPGTWAHTGTGIGDRMRGNADINRRQSRLLTAIIALVACTSALALPARATEAERQVLAELLPGLDPRHLLRATLLTREVIEGHPRRVRGDTLWLAPPVARGADAVLVPVWTDVLVRLEQRRRATDLGAKVGSGSGAAIGGVLGFLLGLWGASWNDDGKDVPIVVVCTMGGAAVVGAAGGLLGAGVGSAGSTWYVIWPSRETERELRAVRAQAHADSVAARAKPSVTRILIEAGYAATGGPYDMTGAALGAGLLGEPRPGLEVGPVMRAHALGGLADVRPTVVSGEVTRLEPIMSLSVDARLARAAPGWRPWVQAGLGLSLASDLYPSAHLGLGIRHRLRQDRDWGFVVGRHFRLGNVADAAHGQWAATLVFTIAP